LLLARVDGKSPVEYVTNEAHKNLVRGAAIPLLKHSPASLADVMRAWDVALVASTSDAA